jgi:hypothetical protein
LIFVLPRPRMGLLERGSDRHRRLDRERNFVGIARRCPARQR